VCRFLSAGCGGRNLKLMSPGRITPHCHLLCDAFLPQLLFAALSVLHSVFLFQIPWVLVWRCVSVGSCYSVSVPSLKAQAVWPQIPLELLLQCDTTVVAATFGCSKWVMPEGGGEKECVTGGKCTVRYGIMVPVDICRACWRQNRLNCYRFWRPWSFKW
jgi:hypothetical protein